MQKFTDAEAQRLPWHSLPMKWMEPELRAYMVDRAKPKQSLTRCLLRGEVDKAHRYVAKEMIPAATQTSIWLQNHLPVVIHGTPERYEDHLGQAA